MLVGDGANLRECIRSDLVSLLRSLVERFKTHCSSGARDMPGRLIVSLSTQSKVLLVTSHADLDACAYLESVTYCGLVHVRVMPS